MSFIECKCFLKSQKNKGDQFDPVKSPFNQSFDQSFPHRTGKYPPWHARRLLLDWSTDTREQLLWGALTAPALPFAHPHCHFWAFTSSDKDYSYKICVNQTIWIMSLWAESRGLLKTDLKSLIFLNSGCSKNTNKNFGNQLLQLFKSGSKLASLDFFERNLLSILLKSLFTWRRGKQEMAVFVVIVSVTWPWCPSVTPPRLTVVLLWHFALDAVHICLELDTY